MAHGYANAPPRCRSMVRGGSRQPISLARAHTSRLVSQPRPRLTTTLGIDSTAHAVTTLYACRLSCDSQLASAAAPFVMGVPAALADPNPKAPGARRTTRSRGGRIVLQNLRAAAPPTPAWKLVLVPRHHLGGAPCPVA